VIGSPIALNSFAAPGINQWSTNLFFNPEGLWIPASASPIYLVKGDELTVNVDPSYPTISQRIILEKFGGDWMVETVLVGQGSWSVKVPVRGIYVLTIEGTVLEGAPQGTDLMSSITTSLKPARRMDQLEPIIYGALIPGLALMVASVYLGGKKRIE
jgi:hypothetical protein